MTLTEIIEKAKIRLEQVAFNVSDDRAILFMAIYSEWKQGDSYVEKQRVRYNNELWRVKKDLVADTEPVEGEEYEKVVIHKM